ncbi:Ohr family peroxiredoxin [Arachidicoccus terrestris]|uniref:Ohr family peroxiredoxin n=1 Tax=Arachidicoccus terrestris TaxID=2875539 RepID=UPI001CC4158E|nr:Ohr family peroxiredoxin [Arachidicoccus terrestris]UAY53943.1 Ohr family peroxiredoxin [Arachidicoccus terrestris]
METQTRITVIDDKINEGQKVLYTGKTHVSGGRDGFASSSDKRLQTKLGTPGNSPEGTNPEQLFAAGWSACFIGAMQLSAARLGLLVPDGTAVDAEVDLTAAAGSFSLQARLNVVLPGLNADQAGQLVTAAHNSCPYSKATKGNMNVQINIVV